MKWRVKVVYKVIVEGFVGEIDRVPRLGLHNDGLLGKRGKCHCTYRQKCISSVRSSTQTQREEDREKERKVECKKKIKKERKERYREKERE